MNEIVHDKVACVIDSGMFMWVAERLARDFETVYLYTHWQSDYPKQKDDIIGTGIPNVISVKDFWPYLDKIDVFVFPGLYEGGLQVHLSERHGKRVFGSKNGDELERQRWKSHELFKEMGIPVPEVQKVRGFNRLTEELKEQEDRYIKISEYRGDMETFHHQDYQLSEQQLSDLHHALGKGRDKYDFLIEKPIRGDDIVEAGFDPYVIDGKFPENVLFGYEVKDESFVACTKKSSELPEFITDFHKKVAEGLKEHKYRQFLSTEIRVGKDKVPYVIDVTCFSDDTEVLTNEGWKLFKDCSVENTFATLNIISGKIEYQNANGYINKPYQGQMILLTNNNASIECLVTPDHDVLRYDRHKKSLFKEKASKLTDKGFIPRTGLWDGGCDEDFELPSYHKEWDFIGQYGHLVCTKIHHDEVLKISLKKWAAFLAWYLAEGSISRNHHVTISQTTRCDELEKVLIDLGFKYSKYKNGFQISSSQLAIYLSQFGKCNEKFIPRYILDASKGVIREFLDNYILADGSIEGNKRTYRTTSKKIIDGLQECIFKVGSVGNILTRKSAGTPVKGFNNGRPEYIRNHDCYFITERLRCTDYWFETQSRKDRYIKNVDYNGNVYCLNVPNGTLYVRRNGKPFWSGNCRFASPPSELYSEMASNFSEIVWYGSEGILIEPIFEAEYGVEVFMYSQMAENDWLPVRFPKKIARWVKLRNYCIMDDVYHVIPRYPDFDHIGAIVAYGKSLKECFKKIDELKEQIQGQKIDIHTGSLDKAMEVIKKGESIGLTFD